MRKRRSNRSANPSKLDASVVLFQGKDPGETEISGRYWSVSLRIAQEMVESGEAERIEVQSSANGVYVAWVETELGMSRRELLDGSSCHRGCRIGCAEVRCAG